MRSLLRWILGIERKISPEEAIAAAKRECERRDLAFREPVGCTERLRDFMVVSPSNRMGGCVFIGISIVTGKTTSFWHVTR